MILNHYCITYITNLIPVFEFVGFPNFVYGFHYSIILFPIYLYTYFFKFIYNLSYVVITQFKFFLFCSI